MSYTCLLMVLCECSCANLIWKAKFNLLDRTDLFIRLHKMFQISFQISKGQKSYLKFLSVRSELLLSIYVRWKSWVTFVRRCFRDEYYICIDLQVIFEYNLRSMSTKLNISKFHPLYGHGNQSCLDQMTT